MIREHEYEVLKRHDVYVVRKVGGGYYGTAWCEGPGILRGSYKDRNLDSRRAETFKWKWRAVMVARAEERRLKRMADIEAKYRARKSATEVRVWR